MNSLIIIAAPSGSGKTTLVRKLMNQYDNFGFSVSATTRQPRGNEQHGKDYYFVDTKTFKKKIEEDAFLEWEHVYEGLYYGTLKSEIERIHGEGHWPLLDIDVIGAVNLKGKYKEHVLAIFIQPPSIRELENRLYNRGTDSEEQIKKRVEKAAFEMTHAPAFDYTIINDDLETAYAELTAILTNENMIPAGHSSNTTKGSSTGNKG